MHLVCSIIFPNLHSCAVVLNFFLNSFLLSLHQIDDGNGGKKDATIDDLIKIVEELTRIH